METTTKQSPKVLSFVCDICGKHYENKPPYNTCPDITTGYGENDKGQIVCYACCAIEDRRRMKDSGKAILYLTIPKSGMPYVSNWPDSLKIQITYIKTGRHNWGLNRYDVWFVFNSHYWHGITIGDNTQLCHCRQTKEIA